MTNAATEAQAPEISIPKKKSGAKPYVYLALAVVVVGAAYFIFRAMTAGRESTDDAQVAADMLPLSVRVGGLIVALPLTDNQAVKKGDVIAEVDSADYAAKVKQAEADLAAANAQADVADAQVNIVLATSKGGLSSAKAMLSETAASAHGADAQIRAAKAALARSQSDADKADADLKRAESLRKEEAIPQAQVDSLRAIATSAHAAVTQSEAQVMASQDMRRTAESRVAEAAGRVEQTAPVDAQAAAAKANAALAHARVASSAASLELAKLSLSYTKVLAPADGHIAKLAVHVGQLAQPSMVITHLLPDATYLVANFKETQVGSMRPGQSATATLDALPGRTFRAKVESVSFGTGAQFSLLPPDNASGNFVKVVQRVPVRLSWEGLPPDLHLQAGLSADVTVDVR